MLLCKESHHLFAPPISTIPFHSIVLFFSTFLILQTILFHYIFFNFLNPYTIFLNLSHSYHLKISKVKQFLHYFSKLFSNHFKSFSNYFFHPNKWDGMGKMPTPNKRFTCILSSNLLFWHVYLIFLLVRGDHVIIDVSRTSESHALHISGHCFE